MCLVMENRDLEKISELLDRLSEKERRIIVLRYIHELPLTEVVKLVDETYANTRTIASRAMRKLKKYAAEEKKGGK